MKHIHGINYLETEYSAEKRREDAVTWTLVVLGSIVFAGVVVWAAFTGNTLI